MGLVTISLRTFVHSFFGTDNWKTTEMTDASSYYYYNIFVPAGVFRKRTVSASSAYTLFSAAAFGYASFTAIKTMSRQPPPLEMSNFNRILLKLGYATLVAPSAIVPVIMWFETVKLQAYLHEWRQFQVGRRIRLSLQ